MAQHEYKILIKTKEGYRAVVYSTDHGIQAAVLNSSIPRCYQIQHVPVVFGNPYASQYFRKESFPLSHPSHIQLLRVNNSFVLHIGRAGLYGGGHAFSCDGSPVYCCNMCHFSCPNNRCYDCCTHRGEHNCFERQADQRRAQEEREERRRAEQERIRQEQQQKRQREQEAREQQQREEARLKQLEQERQQRLRQQREQEELERKRQEEDARREKMERERQEREQQQRLQREREAKQEQERQKRLRQQREEEERKRQEEIARREKMERERQEREQQQRLQREREAKQEQERQKRLQQKREEEERERERQEVIARWEKMERERQEREQQQRLQREREAKQEQERQKRLQQKREEEERERERQEVIARWEKMERERQEREQQQRLQREREAKQEQERQKRLKRQREEEERERQEEIARQEKMERERQEREQQQRLQREREAKQEQERQKRLRQQREEEERKRQEEIARREKMERERQEREQQQRLQREREAKQEQERQKRQREEEERERQEEIARQEKMERERQEREQQQRLQREREAKQEQERQKRLQQKREEEERERERQEQIARRKKMERESQERQRREHEHRMQREREAILEQERQERLRQQREQEKKQREQRERESIKSKLQEVLQQPLAVRDDESGCVSEEETNELNDREELKESIYVQQEGPIETTASIYEHRVDTGSTFFGSLKLSDGSPKFCFENCCNDEPVPESWHKIMLGYMSEDDEKNLIFELTVYPEGPTDTLLLEMFRINWLAIEKLFDRQDRQKILLALRTEQMIRKFNLMHINDILYMLSKVPSEGLEIVCRRSEFWYQHLKRCWIKSKIPQYSEDDVYTKLVQVLVSIPWNSLMTLQVLNAISEERNQPAVYDFLNTVKKENISHFAIMDIITKTYGKDCALAWLRELQYQILINEVFELSQEIARKLDSTIAVVLRKESTNTLINLITSNKHILKSNMTAFASILEHVLTYQTTPEVWIEVSRILNSEEKADTWIAQVDKFIVSTIYGESFEHSADELITRMGACTYNFENINLDDVRKAFKAVKSECTGRFSLFNSNRIGKWAARVKQNYDKFTLEDKIAATIRAVKLCHKFMVRDSQILSLIMLLNANKDCGCLIQVNTGEGKSIIVAMLAVIHALKGVQVDVVTSSTELSIPEVKKQRPFFEMFGFTVDENSGDKKKTEVYECDIVYGTASDFQGDILRTEFLGNECRGNRKHNVVIVDEVDSMLFDSRTHSVRLSNENPGMTHLEVPLAVIWQHIHTIYIHMVEVEGTVYFITEDFEAIGNQFTLYSGQHWRAVSTEVHDKKDFIVKHTEEHLRKLLRKLNDDEQKEYDDYQTINLQIMDMAEQSSKNENDANIKIKLEELRETLVKHAWNNRYPIIEVPKHLRNFALNQIPLWVENAIAAKWVYQKDAHYTVIDGKIIPVNFKETGDLQTNMIWSDGLTQFLQLKEGLRMDPEGISTNFISNVNFFKRYGSNIYGMTGTLGEKSTLKFLNAVYGTDMFVIPPYKTIDIPNNESSGYRCKELAPLVMSNRATWYQSVKENALYHAQNKRGVLIICKYINEVRSLANMLKKLHNPKKVFIYTGEENNFKKQTIDSEEIIIATNIAGRGMDLKTTTNVEEHGGMYVLVTFLPDSFRVEMQNVGRTAREGKRGMAQLIVLDKNNTSMDVLKRVRGVHEAEATTSAIDDANKMLIQDCLFEQFCLLENSLLPGMEESSKIQTWDMLHEGWKDYSAHHLNPWRIEQKAAMWTEKRRKELVKKAFKKLTKNEQAKLTEKDKQNLHDGVNIKVANASSIFTENYIRKVREKYCSNNLSKVSSNELSAFKNYENIKIKLSELAKRYGWGTHERKALEECWGLWLKSKHSDFQQISATKAAAVFKEQFEDPVRHDAENDKIVHNPFFYVLKGNDQLCNRRIEKAVECYDRAIDLDPVFSVNARYCKAQALLSYAENRGSKQQEALRELRKAENLIKSVYRPNLLTFNTLIGQHECLDKTSQHVQHQLDILSQQEEFIQQACEAIKTAQGNNNNVKLTLKSLYEVFSEANEDHAKAVREANGNGLKNLFTVEEKLPRPWGSIITVAIIGITQIGVGCMIAWSTGGALGTGFIAEGVADLIAATTAAIKGSFSWVAWAAQKVVSIAVSVVCSGISSIRRSLSSAKNLGVGSFKNAGKAAIQNMKSAVKDVSRTCKDLLIDKIAVPKGGVNLAIKEVALSMGKGIVKECLNEAGKYCSDKLLMENLEKVISEKVNEALIRALASNALIVKALEKDELNSDSSWKQWFLDEGNKLLKDKEINICRDMFKQFVKGVAEGSIPYAGAVMQIQGATECMITLLTYTDNFIEKFNKVVASHEKTINQIVETSSSTASAVTYKAPKSENQNQTYNQNIVQVVNVDYDSSDILVHQAKDDIYYSSNDRPATVTNLKSVYREPSTPESLANAFGKTITSKMANSIKENIINPALSKATTAVTKKIFEGMEESVSNLRKTIKTERDNRDVSDSFANTASKDKSEQRNEDLGPESLKKIESIKSGDHPQDSTSLALMSAAINRPIHFFDETGKTLIYIVGDNLPGTPMAIKYTPSKDHSVGHFSPLNCKSDVTPSGMNSCAFDAVVSQLSSAEKKDLQIHRAEDMREKIVQLIESNPDKAEKMFQKQAELESIAHDRTLSGGRLTTKKLVELIQQYDANREKYSKIVEKDVEEESSTMDEGMGRQQIHHLIPYSLRNHEAIRKSGFNIDEPINLLACPDSEQARQDLNTKRPVHRGRHSNGFFDGMRKKLDSALETYGDDEKKLTKDIYIICLDERKRLREGENI
ncbi:uncharacterized protein LOC134209247 [Armigeres subalbatus]|uniref:uncharacterized protein LOC134209247 n=1 Tax=Armigeres subalbatus TaxID=124917 RepID=UPI002ED4B69C